MDAGRVSATATLAVLGGFAIGYIGGGRLEPRRMTALLVIAVTAVIGIVTVTLA